MNPFIRTGLTLFVATSLAGLATAQSTERASLSSAGAQGNSSSGLMWRGQVLSADGRYVAFTSLASNLVPNDTNLRRDLFVRDRQTGSTTRVDVSSSGVQANADVWEFGISISADGRYVAFASQATNLSTGDTAGWADVFVHDRQTGQTSRVSVDPTGGVADNDSYEPSLSADGRYVAFVSRATNLVPNDTNGFVDVFVRDLQSGTTSLVSLDSAGAMTNGDSWTPVLSADGRYVAFGSVASNLVALDTNVRADIFLRDRLNSLTTRLTLGPAGVEPTQDCTFPSISADGRYVAFYSAAPNLVALDTNAASDVFLCDTQSGLLSLVSVDSAGVQANGSSSFCDLSADGRFVTFQSLATNLAGPNTNGNWDIFVHEIPRALTSCASSGYTGAVANSANFYPAISGDGRYVTFTSYASNLVTNDTNGTFDTFVRDTGRPGLAFCFGDGTGAACPCANNGLAGRGCENSASTGGALLESSGAPMLGYDTLVLSSSNELPNAPSIFFQGDAAIGGTTFGDGLRCAGGALKRMYVKIASGGVVSAPQAGDLSISARSAELGDAFGIGATRHYQAYYRDPDVTFCTSPAGDLWNVSNALSITWLP